MQKVISFRDAGGELYDIPEDEAEAFRADRPEARPVRTFRGASGELYDIPEEESATFQAEMPQAEPVRSVRTQDGEVFDVPESERATFLKGYRTEPEFQADREAVRARVQAQAAPEQSVAGAAARGAGEGAVRGLKDAGLTLASGVVAVPQVAVGLADIAAAPVTLPLGKGGIVGRTVGKVADFQGTRDFIEGFRSEEQRDVNRKVQSAHGFVGTLKAMARHPTTIAHGIIGSTPTMMAGGTVGQALGMAGMGATAAGALGEGLVTAGQMQEETRARQPTGLTTPLQTGAAVAAGATTAAIAGLANKLAGSAIGKKLGLGAADIDTLLAGGTRGVRQMNLAHRLIAGAAQEGLLEEFPQSANEKIFENLATGRPWHEGVVEAGVAGAVVGATMGAGANLVGSGARPLPPPAASSRQSVVGSGQSPTLPNSPLPNSPLPTPAFAPEIAARVPVLDTSPLPPSPFAAPPAPQPGPTLKAAETLMVNRQVVEGWEAAKQRRDQEMAQQAADAKTAAAEQRKAVRAGTAESKAARARRLSMDSFWEQHYSDFGGLPMIERILAGQSFRAPYKKSGGEYDAWKSLIEKYPELGMMMSRKGAGDGKGVPIDVAALEEKMTPDEMVAQIEREWIEYQAWKARDGRTPEDLHDEEIAAEAEYNLTTPAEPRPAELKPGDMVKTPDGQWRRVEREPDTVILADGTDIALPEESAEKLALQAHVPAGQPGIDEARQAYTEQERAMWADAERERIAAETDAPPAVGSEQVAATPALPHSRTPALPHSRTPELPDLTLQGQTQAEMDAEAEAQSAEAQRQEMLARAAAPLPASTGDQTAIIPGMETEVNPNLFDAADIEARRALGMETGDGGRERKAVGSGQVAVGSGQAAVGSGQAAQDARPAAEMTPDEFEVFAVGEAEQQHRRHGTGGPFIINDQIGFRVRSESQHRREVSYAIDDNNPVSAAAVDAYKIKLPEGYVREGDRYVFKGGGAPATKPAATAQDIRGAGAEQGRSGAVNLPQALSPRAQRAIRRVAALFSQTQGVGEQAYEMVNQMRRSLEAARLGGREARNRIYGIADELSAAHGRPAVLEAIGDVQTGRATPADFSARFGLAPGNEMERFLGAMVRDTDANSKRILKWVGNSKEMRRHADEAKLYQTRAYLLHALGEDYVPPDTARRAAVLEVKAGLADAVNRLARQATAVRGRRPGRRIDVINWLDTGDETFLRTASRTRAEAARQLRRNWLELRQVIDGLALAGDNVTATMNAEAAGKAADGIVEFYLQRGAQRGEGATGPGVETGHLRARFLEVAFRQLYGEITDPAVRQQITTEVQGRMLAEMTLFERIFAECEGSVWARYPDPQRGIMERLGDAANVQDRRRYGDMAGRYVTKEFRDLVDTAQHKGSVYQTMQSLYFGPMALQRMGKLLSPKTISRNYITAVTGLALETGDVFLPGYWGDWAEGHKLAADYARGRPEAIARIRELVELGVFQPGASSYTADMQAALGKSGQRMQKAFKGITEAYTFIDFPTKYAAFMARQRAGMNRQQAAQHVRDMYQARERVPPIVGKVSRIGLADYLSYQYDSVRMALNSLRFASAEARKGHVLPLFGWIAARAVFALTSVQATKMLSEAAGKFYEQVRQALRGIGDDDEDKRKKSRPGITPLEDGQLSRMRDLVAPYDQNAPMLAWREERGGRLERVGYTIAGGQTAFAMDDIITGALQSPQHGQGFLEAVGKSALQILDEGMYVDAAAKAIGGQGFDGRRTPTGKGLWHARPGQEDPERGQIVSDAIKGWIADMAPAYPAQMFVQLMRRAENERAGVRDQGIFARETLSTAEIVARQHRLVRAYTMTRSEMNAQIRNKIMPQKEALERTRQIINQAAGMQIEKGAARPGLDKQAAHAQESRARYLGAIARVLQSARSVAPEWYDGASMVLVLTEAGLPRNEALHAIGIANGVAIDTDYRANPTISPMQTGLYQQLTNPSR